MLARDLLELRDVSVTTARATSALRLAGLAGATAFAVNAAVTTCTTAALRTPPPTPSAVVYVDTPHADETEGSDDPAPFARSVTTPMPAFNPFCPDCRNQPTTHGGLHAADDDPFGARPSQLPFHLAATMEADVAQRSMATLLDTTIGTAGPYRPGDRLVEGAVVVSVQNGRVLLSNGGVLEYISVSSPPPPSGRPPARPDKPQSAHSIDGADEAIDCPTEGECTVDRGFVERLFEHPELLRGQGVARPAKADDGTPGFRLLGVRKGTLPRRIGLRNDDIIVEIAGRPATIDNLASLYGSLRHASAVSMTIDRGGHRLAREITVR